MIKDCLLDENSRNCSGSSNCERCGFNPEEAKRRARMVAAEEFNVSKSGIRKLIIKRKASEE